MSRPPETIWRRICVMWIAIAIWCALSVGFDVYFAVWWAAGLTGAILVYALPQLGRAWHHVEHYRRAGGAA